VTTPILLSKLYIPSPASNLVQRPRLIEKLNQYLEREITLVSAPAGYGKTTLLSAWIQQIEYPTAWISLDETDNEVSLFLEYLVAAFQTIQVEWGKMALAQLPELSVSEIRDPITALLNDIATSGSDVLLVLDDYHVISSETIHETINFMLKHLPPNLRLVIATRMDPPLRLAQLRAKGALAEIRTKDLYFTPKESALFFTQTMELKLEAGDIDRLVTRTEGWIAGLQLAAIALREQPDHSAFIQSYTGDDRYVLDYLMDEVLSHQPREIQTFLLNTAILTRMNAGLCDAVLDWQTGKSSGILTSLDQANLFVIPLDNRRDWYRYHHLFGSLLFHRLKQNPQVNISALHLRASTWYELNGFIDDAIRHAIQANALQRLASLVERHTFHLGDQSNLQVLVHWLDSQPREVLCRFPWLFIAKAQILAKAAQYELMASLLDQAEECFTQPNPRAACAIATLRAYRAEYLGDIKALTRHTEQALACLPPEDSTQRSLVYIFLASAQYNRGDIPASEASLQEAYHAALEVGDHNHAIVALSKAGMSKFMRGAISSGIETMHTALQLAEENQRPRSHQVLSIGYTHILLGTMLIERGEIKDALHQIRNGIRMCEFIGRADVIVTGYSHLSRGLLADGDLDAALTAIQKAFRQASQETGTAPPSGVVESIEADIIGVQLARGDVAIASSWTDRLGLSEDDPITFANRNVYTTFARFLIAIHKHAKAIEVLDILVTINKNACHQIALMKTLIMKAVAHYLKQEEDSAINSLEKALTIAKPDGLIQAFLNEGESMAQLLYQASLQGIYPKFCSQILEHFSRPIQPHQDSQDELIEPLSSRETEVLVLIAKGYTNQEIGQELHLSLYTIKSHARNIFGKLGVKNRTEAVAKARLIGILPNN
jgi:LuxR family maltose regulon positive regulatory protein